VTFLRWLWNYFKETPAELKMRNESLMWGLNPPQPDPYPNRWGEDDAETDEQFNIRMEKHGTSDL